MRMTRPKLVTAQITVAEEQENFKTVTAALVNHPLYSAVQTDEGPFNSVVLAFAPSPEERERIAQGADIYVSWLTFLKPMAGIIVSVGPEEFSTIFQVPLE